MILLWVYLIAAGWLALGYFFWLLDRAVLWTDYVGVILGAIGLGLLWPVYLLKIVGNFTARKHG